jgi:hypothetical protein
MILIILVGMAGLWLAGNWQPVGWTLVAVACLLWLPYALERQAADRESGRWPGRGVPNTDSCWARGEARSGVVSAPTSSERGSP